MPTITFASTDQAVYLADTLRPHGHDIDVDHAHAHLTADALDVLAELADDVDGHFDGEHVWIGGTEYRVEGLITDTPLRAKWAAWLGPAATDATDEQIDQLDTIATTTEQRWPDPDLADTREQVLSGAAQVVLGDDTLEGLATAWRQAREAERRQMEVLTGALLASDTGARSGPGSEADLIERAGVARMTVRKALGK